MAACQPMGRWVLLTSFNVVNDVNTGIRTSAAHLLGSDGDKLQRRNGRNDARRSPLLTNPTPAPLASAASPAALVSYS
jgi:hypothetical protein